MWVVENEDFNVGGRLEYGKKYRLRHLSSANYLSVKKFSSEKHGVSHAGGDNNISAGQRL